MTASYEKAWEFPSGSWCGGKKGYYAYHHEEVLMIFISLRSTSIVFLNTVITFNCMYLYGLTQLKEVLIILYRNHPLTYKPDDGPMKERPKRVVQMF
jgi:hypothetical protein